MLELIGAELLIGTWLDPGIRRLALAVLLESLDQVAEPAAQHTPPTCTAEEPAQIAEHAAPTGLLIGLAGAAAASVLGVRLRAAAAQRLGSDKPGAVAEDAVAALLGWYGARR